jgi:hypothetical protein
VDLSEIAVQDGFELIQYLLRPESIIADEACSGQSSAGVIVLDQAHAPAVFLTGQLLQLEFGEAALLERRKELF